MIKNKIRRYPMWTSDQHFLISLFVLMTDLTLVAAGYFAAYTVRFHYHTFQEIYPFARKISLLDYRPALFIVVLLWGISFLWHSNYKRILLPAIDEFIRILRASFLAIVLTFTMLFVSKGIDYSRFVLIVGGALSFLLIYIERELLKFAYLYWIRTQRLHRRVLIVGSGYLAAKAMKIIKNQGDRAVLRAKLLPLDRMKQTIIRSRINDLFIADPAIDHVEAVKLANFCEENFVDFRLLPNILEVRMGEVIIDESLGIPAFHLKSISLHGSSFLLKRISDVLSASILMGILFVPFALIIILIKATSSGPIFHRQKRVGYRGQPFDFLKFRTMILNAEKLLPSLMEKNERKGIGFKIKHDPRVTAVGRVLRRFSLDELPQLINVLKGEMSLVGPRPQVLWEANLIDEWAQKRLNVLPGITGLWQVSGRAELSYEEMIDLDIFYLEHWSLGLDLKILAKTIPAVLMAKGAY